MTDSLKCGASKRLFDKYSIWFFLCVILAFAIIGAHEILEFPYFFFSDQTQHFDMINGLRGPLFYPIGGGRFFPLVYMEFYPFLSSGMSFENIELSLYAIQAGKLVVFALLLFYMLKLYSHSGVIAFVGFALFIMLGKLFYFIPAFAHTIFTEPLILVLLAAFCVFYFYANATDKIVYYVASLLAMTYALYLKEPVFSSFIVFAFMRLVFFRKEISKRERYFQYLVLLNCMVFLCLYYLLAYTSGSTYNNGRVQGGYLELLKKILIDYRFILPVVLACVRSYFVVIRKSAVMLADVFLLMSLAYMFCFVVLFLDANYYFLPAYFLLWPAFALYVKTLSEILGGRLQAPYCFPVLCLLVIISSVFIVREPLRGGFHNASKIMTHGTLNIMQDIEMQGKKLSFYSPSLTEYEIPFHHAQDNWVLSVVNAFFIHQSPTKNEPIAVQSLTEFSAAIDGGGIGLISAHSPKPKELLVENYPQYEVLDLGFFNLVIHKDYLPSVLPLYCKLGKELTNKSKGFRGHERYQAQHIARMVKEKGLECDSSL